MYRRWKQKKGEASKRLDFGTKSFPNAEERRREEETVFPREIKISVLVPLYNTPEKFLREMIDSVVTQSYKNWELCLADGSDDKHTDVGRICQEDIERQPDQISEDREELGNLREYQCMFFHGNR